MDMDHAAEKGSVHKPSRALPVVRALRVPCSSWARLYSRYIHRHADRQRGNHAGHDDEADSEAALLSLTE
jgi:hypothetical protein